MMTATALELIGARGPTVVEGPFAANALFLEDARGSDRSRRDGRRNERDRNQHRGIAAGERPTPCGGDGGSGRSDRLAGSAVGGLRRPLARRGWAEFRS